VILGLQGIRAHLESVQATLTWLGGEPGTLGIPRPIPAFYGAEIEKQLRIVVEEEATRLVQATVKSRRAHRDPDKT